MLECWGWLHADVMLTTGVLSPTSPDIPWCIFNSTHKSVRKLGLTYKSVIDVYSQLNTSRDDFQMHDCGLASRLRMWRILLRNPITLLVSPPVSLPVSPGKAPVSHCASLPT